MKKLAKPLLIVFCVLCIIFLQMGFIFLLLALLPTITVYYIDNDLHRATFKTVFTCNLAAALPYLLPIFMAGIHFRPTGAYDVMSNPRVWVIVYGGAAVGWCLIYICGFFSRFFISALYEFNAKSLEKFQIKLVEEWGEDIIPKDQ